MPKRLLIQAVLSLARHYLPLREDQRYYWQKSLALQRQLYLKMGDVFSSQGVLQAREDIFFLTQSEIRDPQSEIGGLAAKRKADYQCQLLAWQRNPQGHYPPFLRDNLPMDGMTSNLPSPIANLFHGRPVSPGRATGPARLIHSPAEFPHIQRGDILVVASTDPAWTPIFGLLGGLVMERGGQLSHGAVVAREYGLPAVAAVPGITGLVQNGEMLTVDGSAGTVTRADFSNGGKTP